MAPEAADRIGQIVGYHGHPKEMLETLRNDPNEVLAALRMHPKAKTALDELALLFDFLEAMNALDKLSLDMSLARGLDYYTGVIYEAVLVGGNVGSIAAGGRYDYLVGSFAGKDIPAVGVSIGIERVYAIIEAKLKEQAKQTGVPIRSTDTQVLVSSIGNGMQKKRMEIANLLWSSGICAEFGFKPNPKMGDQINYALENGIPFMVLFGEDEIVDNKVKIKDMKERTEITVSLDDLVAELKQLTTQ
uniref:histidine--tRNA ligase n=2 Tax=Eukaryota TaxID=2759 RepID=A0A7S2Z537_9CHLO